MRFFKESLPKWLALIALLCVGLSHAHTVIVYPGYRGNNLHTNGTVEDTHGLSAAYRNGSYAFPYGMQWLYPCKKAKSIRTPSFTKLNTNGSSLA